MKNNGLKTPIRSFRDLEVYRNSYQAMIEIHRKVLPKIPGNEKYDLKDQLSRSPKAIPRLIAEVYAKRHQRFGFQKYLDDSMAECNEIIVGLEQCRDLYNVDENLINSLVDIYDKSGRQLYKLSTAWSNFKRQKT